MFGLSLLTNKWFWAGLIVIVLVTASVAGISKYNSAIEEAVTYKDALKISQSELDKEKLNSKAMSDALDERIASENKLNKQLESYRREESVYKAKISKLSKRLTNYDDAGAVNDYNDRLRTQLERIQGQQFSSEEIEAAATSPTDGSIKLSPRLAESLLIDLKRVADTLDIIYSDK